MGRSITQQICIFCTHTLAIVSNLISISLWSVYQNCHFVYRELNSNKVSYMVEDINGAFSSLSQLRKLSLAHNKIKSINHYAFTGLVSLAELDLIGNNVTTVQENAFLPMPNLNKLKMNTRKFKFCSSPAKYIMNTLRSNYMFLITCLRASGALVCNCGLQWLSMWLREHHYSEAELHCGFPHWLKGMSLTRLHQANFTCG